MARKKNTNSNPGILDKLTRSALHLKDNIRAATSAVVETAGEKYEDMKEDVKAFIAKKVTPAVKSSKKASGKPARKATTVKAIKTPTKKAAKAKSAVKMQETKGSKKAASKNSMSKKAPAKKAVKKTSGKK